MVLKSKGQFIFRIGLILLILGGCFFYSSPRKLHAEDLVVGAIWFPPFYIIEKNQSGKVTGISGLNIAIITKVLQSLGKPYVLKVYPAKRLYRNLIEGTTDIFYGIRIPPSVIPAQYILHSQTTINKITLRVFHLKQTPVIQSRKDLIGSSVIVFRGYGYGGFIEYLRDPANRIEVHMADTQINGFKMLKKKRADYLVAFERPAFEAISHFPEKTMADVIYSPPLFVADGYFIVSGKTAKAPKLLAEMEAAYHRLKAQGVFPDLTSDQTD